MFLINFDSRNFRFEPHFPNNILCFHFRKVSGNFLKTMSIINRNSRNAVNSVVSIADHELAPLVVFVMKPLMNTLIWVILFSEFIDRVGAFSERCHVDGAFSETSSVRAVSKKLRFAKFRASSYKQACRAKVFRFDLKSL